MSCVCIDDEPEDGPQHYILVLGFHQPHLVAELDAIGVHVASVIKLCSEPAQTSEGQQEQHTSEGSEQSLRASPVLDAGKEPSVYSIHDSFTGLIMHSRAIINFSWISNFHIFIFIVCYM